MIFFTKVKVDRRKTEIETKIEDLLNSVSGNSNSLIHLLSCTLVRGGQHPAILTVTSSNRHEGH
jgi:hypothetical protein